MGFHRINADSKESCTGGLYFLPGITDAACLSCATGCVILGIEVQNDGLTLEVVQGDGSSGAVAAANGGCGEGRGFIADF
jgi:hypothetical protein